MNFAEAMEYIDELNSVGISLGLERVKSVLEKLENPQDSLRCIHIAGTNGKGSVGAFLSSVLQKSGKRVGHYQSPTLFEYRDRIMLNGVAISEKDVAELLTTIRAIDKDILKNGTLTSFEAETVMAFLYFKKKNCDYVILEVGMGGRQDATNVISNPILSIITPISMDHTSILGNSLTAIAEEKAGILKKGCPAVIGIQTDEAMKVLLEACRKLDITPVTEQSELLKREGWSLEGQKFTYGKWNHMRISLIGEYQPENAGLALEALEVLQERDSEITDDMVLAGMQAAIWPGRCEVLWHEPTVIVDGAHNPAGAEKLAETMKYFPGKKIRIAMGVYRDKDYRTMLKTLASFSESICCFSPIGARGLEADKLASEAKAFFPEVATADSSEQALRYLKDISDKEDVILCCGSLSIVKGISEAVTDVFGGRNVEKWNRILHHPVFIETLAAIREQEKDRVFCHHDLNHLLDVARISWIAVLEQNLGLSKDAVYGAALLHDLGRWKQYTSQKPHHIAGAELAQRILPDAGYTEEEIANITEAILYHGEVSTEHPKKLALLLYQADKLSRNCFLCEAQPQCKWPVTQQNNDLRY